MPIRGMTLSAQYDASAPSNAAIDAGFVRESGRAQPLYFDSSGHRLFGWLYAPPGETSADLGLVICKPFGYESICAHRSLRAFAEAAAGSGLPTLRLDYLGSGDSADIDPAADQLEVWSRDVCAAVEELRRRTGVARVCLLGVRLGGLLAVLAAEQCAVDSLILVAPIVSGRRYLRELRTTRLAASMGAGASDVSAAKSDAIEISGFFYSQATLDSLGKIDLVARPHPPVSHMLMIDGHNFPASKAWAEKLAAEGMAAEYRTLPGLVEMVMTAPQFASVPTAMVSAAREWLLLRSPAAAGAGASAAVGRQAARSASQVLELSYDEDGQQRVITERPVVFGPDAQLFGILTEPPGEEARRRAVILLNAGADYHIGASGMSVVLARAWARRGYLVLRMDFAGIGDSGTRPGRRDDEIFPPAAVEDMRSAVELMRNRHGARDVTIAGLCSGAYHALKSGVAGLPVERVLMVNPQNYFWEESMSIHGMQLAELVTEPQRSRGSVFSLDPWRRLLTGKIDLTYILRRQLHRIWLVTESSARDLARKLPLRLPEDLGRDLEEIAARGIRMVFVFSRGEPGLELLKIQAGSSVRRLGERCRLHIIDGADHVFSKLGPRLMLEKILSDELFARAEDRSGTPARGGWRDTVHP